MKDDHGEASTYTNWCCRCLPCTAAYRNYRKRRNQRAAARKIGPPLLAGPATAPITSVAATARTRVSTQE